jgi:predicted O-methyltransferase YrrM
MCLVFFFVKEMKKFLKIATLLFALVGVCCGAVEYAVAAEEENYDSCKIATGDALIEEYGISPSAKVILHDWYKWNYRKHKLRMTQRDAKFLFGLVRKFKPRKILEVRGHYGGSSELIMSAIEDRSEAKLYSIDVEGGPCVMDHIKGAGWKIPHLEEVAKDRWKLYRGDVAVKFLDEIGDGIDFVFLDTAHMNPDEFLYFLMMLPYLKEGAVIVIYDVATLDQIRYRNLVKLLGGTGQKWVNHCLSCAIKGEKLCPEDRISGEPDIAAIILDKDQSRYLLECFNLLLLPWSYLTEDRHIDLLETFIKRHYGVEHVDAFMKAAKFYKERFAEKARVQHDQTRNAKNPDKKKKSFFSRLFSRK